MPDDTGLSEALNLNSPTQETDPDEVLWGAVGYVTCTPVGRVPR